MSFPGDTTTPGRRKSEGVGSTAHGSMAHVVYLKQLGALVTSTALLTSAYQNNLIPANAGSFIDTLIWLPGKIFSMCQTLTPCATTAYSFCETTSLLHPAAPYAMVAIAALTVSSLYFAHKNWQQNPLIPTAAWVGGAIFLAISIYANSKTAPQDSCLSALGSIPLSIIPVNDRALFSTSLLWSVATKYVLDYLHKVRPIQQIPRLPTACLLSGVVSLLPYVYGKGQFPKEILAIGAIVLLTNYYVDRMLPSGTRRSLRFG